jgi:hypothetical protein
MVERTRGSRRPRSPQAPLTVTIVVVEREAYASAVIGGELYLVTRDGDLFKKLGEDDPSDLPCDHGHPPRADGASDRAGVILANKRVLDVAEDLGKLGIGKPLPHPGAAPRKDGSLVVTIGKEAIRSTSACRRTATRSSRPRACSTRSRAARPALRHLPRQRRPPRARRGEDAMSALAIFRVLRAIARAISFGPENLSNDPRPMTASGPS